ncbi:MAG: MoaD/ThiS family protein [Oceanospirillaceae bacterium]|nr:MoaD/ThiS family protein [Oceanospirillaceae bacterium]
MSSIKVVFFASLKDVIGINEYVIDLTLPSTIAQLKQELAAELDNGQALLEKNIQSSVNYEFARDADVLTEEVTEVAFFPPVTGG